MNRNAPWRTPTRIGPRARSHGPDSLPSSAIRDPHLGLADEHPARLRLAQRVVDECLERALGGQPCPGFPRRLATVGESDLHAVIAPRVSDRLTAGVVTGGRRASRAAFRAGWRSLYAPTCNV